MSEYVTRAGDMWDLIAYEQLGSSKYTSELMDANREHLETFIFKAGVRLKLPDIEKTADKSILPPWKRTI